MLFDCCCCCLLSLLLLLLLAMPNVTIVSRTQCSGRLNVTFVAFKMSFFPSLNLILIVWHPDTGPLYSQLSKREKLTSPNGYDLSFIPTATCSKLFASKNENCLILGVFLFLPFDFWVCLQLLNQRPAKIYYYFYIFRRWTRAQNFKYIFRIDLQVNFAISCRDC